MTEANDTSRRPRNHRWLAGTHLLALLVLASLGTELQAGTYHAFGPEEVLHPQGLPTTETFDFNVLLPGGGYLLRIHNGGAGGELGPVSSGQVWLNETLLVGPSDFQPGKPLIEKPVTLAESNTLTIGLLGGPGGVSIEILGNDEDPPTITAAVSPAPNEAGWHNEDDLDAGGVTVSFECSDATSGVASCSAPVVVTTEGANQIVTGQAVDLAGNSSEASVAISIDATPPSVDVFSPADGATIQGFSFTTAGAVEDALSGVSAAELDGSPLELEPDGEFSLAVDLPDAGTFPFVVSALDVAGNGASASFLVHQEKTEYLEIEVVLPAPGDGVSIQRESGWPLVLQLTATQLVGIGTQRNNFRSPVFPARFPDGSNGNRGWLVFDLGPDDFFSPLCPNPRLPECRPESDPASWPPADETTLEFTVDTDQAEVDDATPSNAEVRATTQSGEAGVPRVTAVVCLPSVSDTGVFFQPRYVCPAGGSILAEPTYGPFTGGNVSDGYGYGPNDDLPGLVVLSDTGSGVVFDEDFNRVEPLEARNLSGFFEDVTYELSDASGKTSVVTSMSVPRLLFSPLTLYDMCRDEPQSCPTLDRTDFDSPVLARTDGGEVVDSTIAAVTDALNARVVTVRIFAVNGIAPSSIVDLNDDGIVDARDAESAGLELLSAETVLRFRQFYDFWDPCRSGLEADWHFFDLDASGTIFFREGACPPGSGGVIDPPR